MLSDSSRIKSFVRIRPSFDSVPAISKDGTSVIINDTRLDFDAVFDHESSIDYIFARVCRDIVTCCVDGFNGTLLVYGQTGSGKTTTLCAKDGLMPRSLALLFDILSALDSKSVIYLSFLQIYNEKLFDLLSNSNISIKSLSALSRHPVTCFDHADALITKARGRLVFGETEMNRQSSRSHAVCFLELERFCSSSIIRSTLTFCDLAGSERVKKSAVVGSALTEAKNINRSLLELGNVVAALAAGHKHVPFRNSMLTRTLRASLSGNCATSLIVCVSCLSSDLSESKSTLQFGQRAMKIASRPKLNVSVDHRKLALEALKTLTIKEEQWSLREAALLAEIDALKSGCKSSENQACLAFIKHQAKSLAELDAVYENVVLCNPSFDPKIHLNALFSNSSSDSPVDFLFKLKNHAFLELVAAAGANLCSVDASSVGPLKSYVLKCMDLLNSDIKFPEILNILKNLHSVLVAEHFNVLLAVNDSYAVLNALVSRLERILGLQASPLSLPDRLLLITDRIDSKPQPHAKKNWSCHIQ